MAGELRLAFFGTPEFAVPTLQRLIDGRHELVAVVCQPDRPRGRGRRASPAPVAELSLAVGIPTLRPERVATPEFTEELLSRTPDMGVVVAFGQFLPKRIRELPSRGFLLNGHASLLPRHRGAAPIVHAILAGDAATGVSAMRIEREMDAGPVALQREIAIRENESAGELSARLAILTANVLEEAIEQIASERVVWTPQDATRVTQAPKIERGDTRLAWSAPSDALVRQVRAMAPTPGAFTTLEGVVLRVLDARSMRGPSGVPPGTVQSEPGQPLRIATGDGWFSPRVLQRPGKRPLDVDEFLRGRPISDGALFV